MDEKEESGGQKSVSRVAVGELSLSAVLHLINPYLKLMCLSVIMFCPSCCVLKESKGHFTPGT